MPTQRLVIDGDNKGDFSLTVHDGTLTVGGDPAHAGIVLPQLRIARIHCVVDLEDGPVVVGNDPTAAGAPDPGQTLHPGEAVHAGAVHVRLVPAPAQTNATPTEQPRQTHDFVISPPAASLPPTAASVGKRLVVIDGADLGQSFPISEAAATTIGNNQKFADIVLHDLNVSRTHCELHVEAGRVMVTHKQGRGTRINGKEITAQELQLGDILRVGNSHMRFEIGVIEPVRARDRVDEPAASAVAPKARLGEAAPKNGGTGRPLAPVAEPPPEPAPDPLMQLEGQVVGQYQFGTLLGRGLSGLVFHARQRQTNQPVVIKVLSADFPANDAESQNFGRALKVVAPLRHPHLVTLHGAGRMGPYCWLAREYVDGESLAALIARLHEEGKLGWKRACRVAIHLGQVLDFLQQHEVTPRRLTPKNILIQRDTKITKLADVMLDQAIKGSRLADVTQERRQLAELPYCAPEETEPGATADHRAGLYAVGAMLYAVLTGQPPFPGDSSPEIIARIQEGKLVKPSKMLRDTPPPFEAAVLKLLARRPADRFQSAAEMLDVVEPIANIHEIKV